MPRCLEPGQRFSQVLECDKDKPEGEQPKFWFKGVPARSHLQAADDVTANKSIEPAIKFLKATLVGWENMVDPETKEAIAFDVEKLDTAICATHELWELFYNFRVGGEEKKS
jgi:hypothetical protein